MTLNNDLFWYKNAVFYEVHIRSFCDSNGDGRGDLAGITSKLDYIKELGVDCIWLLPMFPSPLKDDGYDIADYFNVHPDYGTVEDFKTLVNEAHARGIRIIADLVLNHTSDEHPWFVAARSSRDNPYRDYYVWSDTDQKYGEARIIFVDTEPSNWSFDEISGQYYWHRFFSSQPDLNFDNPAWVSMVFGLMPCPIYLNAKEPAARTCLKRMPT
jgi:maltose alpha-D-glucosyltransferase/alpha-amylase